MNNNNVIKTLPEELFALVFSRSGCSIEATRQWTSGLEIKIEEQTRFWSYQDPSEENDEPRQWFGIDETDSAMVNQSSGVISVRRISIGNPEEVFHMLKESIRISNEMTARCNQDFQND